MPFFELHSAFNFGKLDIDAKTVMQKKTQFKSFVIVNHHVSGWRKENENRWNFFVSESTSIRNGMNPLN